MHFKRRSSSKNFSVIAIWILVMIYFTFHILYGSRGIISYMSLGKSLKDKYIYLNELRSDRLYIDNIVNLLGTTSLDSDILDENSRHVLGLVNPEESFFSVRQY
ncbi:septum formation initiator family protein [Rickettsia endosymbiont of Cardiosporidium cionae]|uniref:septum formation initiator family protein n=1 Tax=Rickettsia endosymbiont of Cardiosporidium cionae TaxID=2777155 RepID=UPI0018954AEF|nr:septum formation initiator family protein [Rickettsia endosymbiont of Cardiosporidium cionae]KAF8818540.1 septum formation initiator family protein [Rickettsia endosymbiont of Cardiosporidium cionae]